MKLFAPFLSDGYKATHADMYADGTEVVSSNLTPRGDKIYKRTYTRVNGKCIPIFKDPKTDSSKKSAKGLLFVHMVNGVLTLVDNVTMEMHTSEENLLKVRFLDGRFYNMPSIDEIRAKLMV